MAYSLSKTNPPKTVKVTRRLANEFRDMDPVPRDRPKSEYRMDAYRMLVKQKKFRPVQWAKAWCKETEGHYRVNGKHTSHLFSEVFEAGKPEDDFYVTIEEYECDTLDDVVDLYGGYDSKMQARTSRDINLTFAGIRPELNELSGRTINAAVMGINYFNHAEGMWQVPLVERAEVILKHPEFFAWFNDLAVGEKCRKLMRGAVIAAIFGCWQKAPVKAGEFWSAVRDGTGSPPVPKNGKSPGVPGDPDRVLCDYLQDSYKEKEGRTAGDRRRLYVKCLHGWNAWRKGSPTDLKYYDGGELPKIA